MTIPSQSQILQQAAEKEQLAATLTRYASQLAEVFAGALARPHGIDAFWKGPAAGRFSSQAVQLAREIDLLRENCTSAADRLRKQAEAARAEAAQMPT
ncbi:hypothetical protein [Nonomuraea glycinis]|uniref:hypothetical protein n=1 Tax=Nonomuraea glycinis TaxID=2047744 RepID=UPI002E0F2890|nr:hypothetical protein OHA68_06810 [Nonomuraea glycinis]